MATSMPEERLLYPIPEAAHKLGLSRSKLYEMIARQEIRVVRIGGSVRITADELRRFVGSLA